MLSVRGKNEELILAELQLLIKLLQAVPPAAYAPNGVSVSWTKVSESHSMPVVFPEALNAQLRILLRDQYIRTICDHLLSFNPGSLRRPLANEKPAPMYPTAPTIAVCAGISNYVLSPLNGCGILCLTGTIWVWRYRVVVVFIGVHLDDMAKGQVGRKSNVGEAFAGEDGAAAQSRQRHSCCTEFSGVSVGKQVTRVASHGLERPAGQGASIQSDEEDVATRDRPGTFRSQQRVHVGEILCDLPAQVGRRGNQPAVSCRAALEHTRVLSSRGPIKRRYQRAHDLICTIPVVRPSRCEGI